MGIIKEYAENLDRFYQTLPVSPYYFLYFLVDRRAKDAMIPYINTNTRKLVISGVKDPLYVYQNKGGGGFIYLHRESELKYDILIDAKGGVQAFDPSSSSLGPLIGGGHVLKMGNWGSHITIGLQKSYTTKKLLLMSHKTEYIHDDSNPGRARRREIECNTYFDEVFDDRLQCVDEGVYLPMTVGFNYVKRANDPDAIKMIATVKEIYKGNYPSPDPSPTTSAGGNKTYITRNGKKYRVHAGPRGGHYVHVRSKKVYIRHQTGGNPNHILDEDRGLFRTEFVSFMANLIQPVLEHDASFGLTSVQIIYDKTSDGLMVTYNKDSDISNHDDIFHIDAQLLHDVFTYTQMTEADRLKLAPLVREAYENKKNDLEQMFMHAAPAAG